MSWRQWLPLCSCLWPTGVPGQGPSLFCPQRGSACVLCHPAVPPRITLPPNLPSPVLLSAPVRLTCNATGIPTPTLMWLKDGNPVSPAGTSGLQVRRLSGPCLGGCWELRGEGVARRGGRRPTRGQSRPHGRQKQCMSQVRAVRDTEVSSNRIKVSVKKPILILRLTQYAEKYIDPVYPQSIIQHITLLLNSGVCCVFDTWSPVPFQGLSRHSKALDDPVEERM